MSKAYGVSYSTEVQAASLRSRFEKQILHDIPERRGMSIFLDDSDVAELKQTAGLKVVPVEWRGVRCS